MLANGDLPVDRHLLDLEQDKARLQEMALTSLDFNLQAERNLLIKASDVILSVADASIVVLLFMQTLRTGYLE